MSKLLSWANDILEAVDNTAAQVRQETQEWREEERREAAEASAREAAEREAAVRSWNMRYQQQGDEPPPVDGPLTGDDAAEAEEAETRLDASAAHSSPGGASAVPRSEDDESGGPWRPMSAERRVPRSREAYRQQRVEAEGKGRDEGPTAAAEGGAAIEGGAVSPSGFEGGMSRSALQERVDELEREVVRLKEDAASAAALFARELEGLRQGEMDAMERVDQKSADVMDVRRAAQLRESALEAAMTAQARELASARREVDEREKRADAARKRADAAEVALAKERGGTAREVGAREELQREMVALVTALRDELIEKEDEVKGLGARLARKEAEHDALGRRAADAEERWSRADAELRARGPSAGPGAPDALVRDLAATIEALAAKQRAVEELTTDRHAMQLRVEALSASLSEAQARVHALQSGRDMDGGLRGMSRRPGLGGREGGEGHQAARRSAAEGLLPYRSELSHLVRDLPEPVAKALVAADRAALGTLKMLRIHPVPRLLLFAYVCALNLWVFFGLSLFLEHAHGGGGHSSGRPASLSPPAMRTERLAGQHPLIH